MYKFGCTCVLFEILLGKLFLIFGCALNFIIVLSVGIYSGMKKNQMNYLCSQKALY